MNEFRIRIEEDVNDFDEPCYVISIAARMVGMHAQTLRQYERLGLVSPKRSQGNIRLYSRSDVAKLRQVQRLVNDLGVNLAGVEVILRMGERIQGLEAEVERLRAELQRQRDRRLPAPRHRP
jgi:MerR family transcriptional regulator/heat shock protein HspR